MNSVLLIKQGIRVTHDRIVQSLRVSMHERAT